jgi:serine/threonine-protein kinase
MIHLDLDVDLDLETTVAPSPIGDRSFLKPHAPPSQLPAICTYGRYEILGRVAFGGMAEIFLGRENLSAGASRMLVIKRILPQVADDPTFVEMFLDEARLAIQLSHPNICHIYEFGEVEGTYFIAMEWIHGASLGKIIRRAREGAESVRLSSRLRRLCPSPPPSRPRSPASRSSTSRGTSTRSSARVSSPTPTS